MSGVLLELLKLEKSSFELNHGDFDADIAIGIFGGMCHIIRLAFGQC